TSTLNMYRRWETRCATCRPPPRLAARHGWYLPATGKKHGIKATSRQAPKSGTIWPPSSTLGFPRNKHGCTSRDALSDISAHYRYSLCPPKYFLRAAAFALALQNHHRLASPGHLGRKGNTGHTVGNQRGRKPARRPGHHAVQAPVRLGNNVYHCPYAARHV